MITFTCPCGKQLAAKEEHAGKQTACPACGNRLPIPAADEGNTPMFGAAQRDAPPPTGRDSEAQDFAVAGDAPRRPADDEFTDRDDRPRRRRDDDEDDDAIRPGRSGRRDFEDDDDDDRPRRRRMRSGETSAAAVTSLVAGILSFFCFWLFLIPNIVAVITGIVGIVATGQGKKGRGMAIAGLACGILSLVSGALVVLPAVLLPAVQKVREAAIRTQSANNLKQIGIAFHMHNDVNQRLPNAATYGPNGQPLLSWRVALLPFLEHEHLYRQFKLDEPWDGPNNIRLLEQMPNFYHCPLSTADKKSMTHYQVFVGKDGKSPGPVFRRDPKHMAHIARMIDGTSNTILVVEATNPVPWTKPQDINFPWAGRMPELGVEGSDFNVLMGDGAVFRRNALRLSPETLRNVVIMDDGQPVPADWRE